MKLQDLQTLIGKDLGTSDWMVIDQSRINDFADTTEDHQFLHVDVEAAKNTPFGGTIAHGFLTVSLLPALMDRACGMPDAKMSINYGMNTLRFLNPVKSGARIRARFKQLDLHEKRENQWQQTVAVTVEIEGEEKPALLAEWIFLHFF